jgi:MbtH protein
MSGTTASGSDVRYKVVVNQEEQYSIWFADRPLPLGWSQTATEGTREECLAAIAEVWTDLTPRSVRERHSRSDA